MADEDIAYSCAKDCSWSEPMSLEEAVPRAPVLVRLEEGERGRVESLSFSLGDLMALEGHILAKGKRLVLAHFTSEMEPEDGAEAGRSEERLYRSLLTIPWDQLPQVEVRVCHDDPGHAAYSNFLTVNFPHCNWRVQQKQLLDTLDDGDYDNIREITPVPRVPPTPSTGSKRRPPPPLPELHDSSPHPQKLTPSSQPIPRPPFLPPKRSADELDRKGTMTTHQQGDEPDLAPPPRPPRNARSPTTPAEESGAMTGSVMPTLAELFSSPNSCLTRSQSSSPDRTGSAHKPASVGKPEALFPSEMSTEEESRPTENQASEYDVDYLELLEDEPVEEFYLDVKELTQSKVLPTTQQKNLKLDATDKEGKKIYKEEKKKVKKLNPPNTEEQKKMDFLTKEKWTITTGKEKGSKPVPVKPTVRVQPLTSPTSPMSRPPMPPPLTLESSPANSDEEVDSYDEPMEYSQQLQKMTCKQLCARLQVCGMPALARACHDNCLDGAFFCSMSDNDLKKPPFSLNDFEVNTKLRMVKSGWVPK